MYVCTSMFACTYVLLKGSNIIDHYGIRQDHPLDQITEIATTGSTSGILVGLTSKIEPIGFIQLSLTETKTIPLFTLCDLSIYYVLIFYI